MPDARWPVCTAHPRDCGHATTHDTPEEANEFARARMREYVTELGYAICTCHPLSEAEALGITPFPCTEGTAL